MRLEGLQLARGVAAMLVVLHHIEGKLQVARPEESLFLNGVFGHGWIGVDFFFVLSGFIIALTLSARPSPGNFLKRRFVRVHLPFWVAFAVTLLGAMLSAGTRAQLSDFSAHEWLLALALLPSGQSAPVIGVAWTLHHEIFFYALASLWLIWPVVCSLVATALLAGSLFVSAQADFPLGFVFSPLHWEFLFGVLAFVLHRRISPDLAKAAMCCAVAWITAWALVSPAPNQTEDPARVIQHGIGMALFCLGLAALEASRGRSTQRSPSAYLSQVSNALGDWSYGLYLIHIPIILALIKVGDKLGSLNSALGIQLTGMFCFIACLGVSWLFHEHLERPLVRWANQRLAAPSGP